MDGAWDVVLSPPHLRREGFVGLLEVVSCGDLSMSLMSLVVHPVWLVLVVRMVVIVSVWLEAVVWLIAVAMGLVVSLVMMV